MPVKDDQKFDLDRWEAIRRAAASLQQKLDGGLTF